jgi:tetratricopeptide (TPR) repeat protein
VLRRLGTNVDDPRELGRRLRTARLAAGLSQRALSFPGCTPAYISRLEAGDRRPSAEVLRKLAKRLDVTAEFLATGDTEASGSDPLLEAELAARLGDHETAQRLYAEARGQSESPRLAARAAAGLGQLAFRAGDHSGARPLLEEAVASGLLQAFEEASAVESLGRTLASLGRYEEAFALLEEARAFACARNDTRDATRFSILLANALVDRGNFTRAEELLGTTIASAAEVLDPTARASIYWSQSRLHATQNHADVAARYARMALDVLLDTEHTVYVARAFHLLAYIELGRGRAEEALELLSQGEEALAQSENRVDRALLRLEQARAYAALGDLEHAASVAMAATDLFGDASPADAGRGYTLIADVYRQLGEPDKALELYELADSVLPEQDHNRIPLYTAMAELLEAEGRTAEALVLLKKAIRARDPAHR